MKKNRLKNYLRIGTLLFGVSLILNSCEKDETSNTSFDGDFKKSKVKLVSESDIPNIIDFLENNTVFGRNNSLNRTIGNQDNSIDLENALQVVDSLGNINHTFRLNVLDNDETTFYNLIVHQNQDSNNPNAYVYQFKIDDNYLETFVNNDYNFSNFTGIIKRFSLDAFLSSNTSFFNRVSGADDCACEETDVSSNGSSSGGGGSSGSTSPGSGSPIAPGSGSEDSVTCVSEFLVYDCNGGGGHNGSTPACTGSFQGATTIRTTCSDGNSSESGNIFSRMPEDDCLNPCEDGNIGETAILPPKSKLKDCDTSAGDIRKVFPNISFVNAKILSNVINDKGKDFGIDTKEKLQHFLSQAGHEVGGFNNGFGVEESTNYTTKARLLKIFGKYYSETDTINKKKPDTYVSNPSGHANYVYCCRMGNGDEASGDGYKFRGRGIFQLTGKTNYNNFKTWYNNKYNPDKDFIANPELLKDNDTIAILSALWYYKTSVLDKITVDSATTVKKITKKVNGGTNGLKDREEIFTKAKDSIKCNNE